jgi:DNA primase small subunit
VPIKIEDCENFNPLTVPNLKTLRQELAAKVDHQDTERKMADFKKTSLKPYIEYFEKFVMDMLMEVKKNKRGKNRLLLYLIFSPFNTDTILLDDADRSMEF